MKRTMRALTAATLLCGAMSLTATTASAAPFADGSFEDPNISPQAFQNFASPTVVGGWFVYKGNVNLLRAPTFAVSDGSQAMHLSGTSPASPATFGGVSQTFDVQPGRMVTIQYDWTSRCAGSNVKVLGEGPGLIDSASNPSATYPTYATRTVSYMTTGPSTSVAFDTTTPGSSSQICGTIIDNVRVTQGTGPLTPAASAASQCSGATGNRVQFRKSTGSISTGLAGLDDSKALYDQPTGGPTVAAASTHNGVPYINYADVPTSNQFPSRPSFDVGDSTTGGPLAHVAGAGAFATGAQDYNFAMRSTGYINIPTPGVWTFTTNTDDASRLIIGNTLISEHDTGTASNPVSITTAGCYHYSLEWVQTAFFNADAVFTAAGPSQPTNPSLVGDTAGGSSLAVYQGTDSPTSCKINAVFKAPTLGPNDVMWVTASDPDGLGGVYNKQYTNLFGIADGPSSWTPGLAGPLLEQAVKFDQTQPASFSFTVSDFNGTEKICT